MAEEAEGGVPEEILSLWEREQAQLKARVVDRDTEEWQREPAFSGLRRVGGVDLSFVKGDCARACASLVVLSYPELEVLYEDNQLVSLSTPYVPGFLAFREVPFLRDAMQRLRDTKPSLVPQAGFGVACHLGILTDLPCIGVAKKLLQVDGLENNALHRERALRSHDRSTNPLYVSVGHKVSLQTAVRLTHSCCRFRIPEPVRQADIRSREHIRRTLGLPAAPEPAPKRSQKVHPKGNLEETLD
ncbi:endonuclease V isoform X8 [Erinaceus europaeus]|uniref:Endonuclease V isoform X8 n=1 Tax=Erinaceus europaeus TaxID=9365 RepID=A0ABM3VU04_ERIEU|nr:endonuclease V isoform X8 [Erinaceus europaeus]